MKNRSLTVTTANRLAGIPPLMIPTDELDLLRTEAAAAAGRLLSALHGRQARARAELDQLEAEIAALETLERGVTDIAASAAREWPRSPQPERAVHFAEPPPPNGVAESPIQNPQSKIQNSEPPDLRDTPIGDVLAELAPTVQESLLADCRFCGIETVRHLVDYIRADGEPEGPRTLQDLCSTEAEVKYLSAHLRAWALRNGFNPVEIGMQGLPTVWLVGEPAEPAEPELQFVPPKPRTITVIGKDDDGVVRSRVLTPPKPKKPKPPAEAVTAIETKWTSKRLFESAKASLGKSNPDMVELGKLSVCGDCWAMRHSKEAVCPHCKADYSLSYHETLRQVLVIEDKIPPPSAPPVPAADLTGLAASGQSWKPADLLEAVQPQFPDQESALASFKRNGANDGQLTAYMSESWSDKLMSQSGDSYSVAVSKKLGPQWWNAPTGYKSKKPATLSGPALLTAVRTVLEIGLPK